MTDYEAIKAGAKEAVTEWLDTTHGQDAIANGVKFAVLGWFELSTTGQAQIPWATERAVTAWLAENRPALLRTLAETMANRRTP
ncbi:hypothetical protein [Streptomyces sp. SM1]|uniref:hypothetical protein n=1 Tax=Streptomyces sp. SM1 TaxID=402229 RepID=UPI000CD56FF5|nr:hypothetical protein [Streptomyces sp. SM1]